MLTTSVDRLEGIAVKLTVTVPAADVDAAIDRAYKAIAKQVKVPGFRPGKAPRSVLDTMIGRDTILAEATEDVVNSTYSKALDLEALRPIESPELEELETVEPGAEFTYSAQIDVRPELALSSYDGVTVALPERDATGADVDEQMEMIRERYATLELVEDRGVEKDDFVLVSFTGLIGGEPYEGNQVDKYLYEMGRGMMPEEFDAGIIGLKAGDETTVEFEIPDTSSNPEFVGKTASFSITVHEVKAKVLPALDDEFASNVGGFETLAELREDLKTRINLQKGPAYDRLRERRARVALAERLEGDVPEAMIVSRQSSMTRDFISMLEEREMNIMQYLEGSGIDMDTFEADIREQAIQSVREDLALESLFRKLGLEIADEDLAAEFEEIAKVAESTVEEARQRWEENGMMGVLREQITHSKAVDWLLDNITVTPEAPESTEE